MLCEPETEQTENDALHLPLPRLVESSFSNGALTVLTDEALFEACTTRVAFTNRHGGVSEAPYRSLNLADHVGDDLATSARNRLALLEALGCADYSDCLVMPNQVHGTHVVFVDDVQTAKEEARSGADAVVCGKPHVPVLLCFADCVPVVLVAPDGAFAIAHAGWRGARAGIAGKALKELAVRAKFGAGCRNAYIGPHIGPCCYEVDDELLQDFCAHFGTECSRDGKLDLGKAVRANLLAAGMDSRRIVDCNICTSCNNDSYYSYRREGVCGRHGAFAVRM